MTTQAQARATNKYHAEKMDNIQIRVLKSEDLPARIKAAALKQGIKPAQYIRSAILAALARDEVPQGEDLPGEDLPINSAD